MKKTRVRVCVLMLCGSMGLSAQIFASESIEPLDQTASQVDRWLDLQTESDVSREHKRVEGEMSQRAYRRLLESFEHPIPVTLYDGGAGDGASSQ